MKFDIKHKISGDILFSCELPEDIANLSPRKQLGWAVLEAMKSGADLCNANLSGANLRGASLRDASLCDADLSRWIPRIDHIHHAVYAAASEPDAFDMHAWHKTDACGTTHCRAGWVIHLAGPAGQVLEGVYGTSAAAALIYQASDPELERTPDFYADNETALADMQRLAEAEGA